MSDEKSSEMEAFEPWRIRLAEAFYASGLQKGPLSKQLGRDKDYIARLIDRGTANPTPNLFIEICEALEVSPAFVISGENAGPSREQVARKVLNADSETLRRIEQILDIIQADSQSE